MSESECRADLFAERGSQVHDLELGGAQLPVRGELDAGLARLALHAHVAQVLVEPAKTPLYITM